MTDDPIHLHSASVTDLFAEALDVAQVELEHLTEAKKAFPIGTLQWWTTGVYQKTKHSQTGPDGKKPNDWVLLTSKIKLPQGQPKVTYVPGSVLPPQLQQFSFDPAKNGKGKAPVAAPAQTAPTHAIPPEPEKKPEVQDPEKATADLKAQGSESPDDTVKKAVDAAKSDHPADPEDSKDSPEELTDPDGKDADQPDEAPEDPAEIAKEPPQAIVEPPPQPQKPPSTIPHHKLPSEAALSDAVTPQEFHMWGIKLYQALAGTLKLGEGEGPMGMIKALKLRGDLVSELDSTFGQGWFAKYSDAYLVFKADKEVSAYPNYVPNLHPAFNKQMQELFDKNWFSNYKKLSLGAEFGSVGAAQVATDKATGEVAAATPVLAPAPADPKPPVSPEPAKPTVAPPVPTVPMVAPPEPVLAAQQAVAKENLEKLLAFVDAGIQQFGTLSKALTNTDFVKNLLKTYGHGWLPKYTEAKQVLNLKAAMQQQGSEVSPIASAPPAVPQVGDLHAVPVKGPDQPPETTKSPDEEALVKGVDGYLSVYGHKSAVDLVMYPGAEAALELKYGDDWLTKYKAAKAKKDDANTQAMIADVEKSLADFGLNAGDLDHLTSFPNGFELWNKLKAKYGHFWKVKYKKAKQEQGGTQPLVNQDGSPGSQQALANASVVADFDKQVEKYLNDFWGYKKDPLDLDSLGNGFINLSQKFGTDWKDQYKKAKELAKKGIPAVDAEASELIKDAEALMWAGHDPVVVINKGSPNDEILNKKYGIIWKQKYTAAKQKQLTPQAVPGASVGPQQPSTPSSVDLVAEIDKGLQTSGVPFSVMASNTKWKEKLTAKYGSDWEEKYKKAKNLTPIATAAVPPVGAFKTVASATPPLETPTVPSPPGTSDLSFIQGDNSKPNLKSVMDTAIQKLVPKNYQGDPLDQLQGNYFFKLKMKKVFGNQWATNYKKLIGSYKKPGADAPGQPTSVGQAAAKAVTAETIVGDIQKSQESLVPTLQTALKKMYDADPSMWNHNMGSVLPDLMSHADFDAAMSAKFGTDWKQTYEAITGVVPGANPSEAFAGYVFPPMTDLKVAGDAQKIGGNKKKWFLKDQLGNTFIFKPSADAPTRAYAGEYAAKIASTLFHDDGLAAFIPVKAALHPEKGFGSIQPYHADTKSTLAGIDLQTLNKDQIRSLMRERLLDWAIGNHDTKPAQFILMGDGSIKGTDKEQANKFIGQDQLSTDYHVSGANPPIYNDLFKKYASKELELDPNDLIPYIDKAEKTSELSWSNMASAYIDAAAEHNGADKATLLKKILGRKKNLRSDFEKFFTDLKQKRGELKSGEVFQFDTSTQPKPAGPHELPYANDLSYKQSGSHLGGAGYKDIYHDKTGKPWLFKLAQEKSGNKAKPYSAHVQAGFSKVATKVKSNHLPIGVTLLKTEMGTIQPYIDPPPPTLSGVEPKDLTFAEKVSLAAEHVLDWGGSQHDSHGKQLLKVNGEIVGIDKEQGFRYFDFGQGDKLSIDWKPPMSPETPYYNKFWGDWKDNKFSFDPQTMAKYVDAWDKVGDNEYIEGYKGYAQSLYPTNPFAQTKFLNAALLRKKNVRKDFEHFITDLYKNKTGHEGFFNFKQGWKQGKAGFQIIKHVLKATDAMGKDQYGGIQQKVYMDPNTGAPDANKITLKLAKHYPADKLQKFLSDFGLTPTMPIVTGGVNHITAVNKKDLQAAKTETEETIDTTLEAAPQPVSPHGFPHVPLHVEPKPNAHELHVIHQQKIGPGGKRLTIGGTAVENQVAKAIKYKDKSGKDYFLFNFKLLKSVWEPLVSSGASSEFKIPLAKYDADSGTYVEGGLTQKGITGSGETYVASMDTKKWTNGSSEVHISHSTNTYSWMGSTFAKIYPKEDQTPHDALVETLNKVKPGLADQILKDPTPEQSEVVKLSRIAWALDPQGYQKLSNPNTEKLKSLLLKKSIADSHIDSAKLVETVAGGQTYVMPGRYKKLAGGKLKYLFNGISDKDAAFSVIQRGLLGINERALHGLEITGGSPESDIESGSGDGILTRVVTEADTQGTTHFNAHPYHGAFQALIAPDELDRLDAYYYSGDEYGRCREDFQKWVDRAPIENALSNSHKASAECSFRKGINSNKILRMVTPHSNAREALIKDCKKAGILEVNGVPVDEFVVVCTGLKEAYETYVKPMGY